MPIMSVSQNRTRRRVMVLVLVWSRANGGMVHAEYRRGGPRGASGLWSDREREEAAARIEGDPGGGAGRRSAPALALGRLRYGGHDWRAPPSHRPRGCGSAASHLQPLW